MKRDLLLYQRALFLRRKKGYSYREIREEITVSKSTLSGWLGMIELTPVQKRRIRQVQIDKMLKKWGPSGMGEWNRKRRQEQIIQIRAEARGELKTMTQEQLFITGIMLYWAEGNKGGKELRISNSDPIFIALIMKWFRECLKISEHRFQVRIHFHEGQDEMSLRKYWSHVTKIPLSQFRKGFCKPPGTGHRKHYLQWGTVGIRIRKGADLYHKIVGWREALIGELISGT